MIDEINKHKLWVAISEKFPEDNVKTRSELYYNIIKNFELTMKRKENVK